MVSLPHARNRCEGAFIDREPVVFQFFHSFLLKNSTPNTKPFEWPEGSLLLYILTRNRTLGVRLRLNGRLGHVGIEGSPSEEQGSRDKIGDIDSIRIVRADNHRAIALEGD